MAKNVSIGGRRPDYLLLAIVATLLVIGLIMIYSSTYEMALENFGEPRKYFVRQLLWVSLGFGALLVMMRFDYHVWRRLSVPIMTGTLLLLVALLLLGASRFGARRSLLDGSVQPGELAKLAVIIYMADWLSSKGDQIRQVTYGLIPFAILIGVVTGLIMLQPDLSTSMLVASTAVAMFFITGADILQLVIASIFGSAAVGVLILQAPYRLERFNTFFDPFQDPAGKGYQIIQIIRALVRGGLFGQGLGNGEQWTDIGYVPAAHTDAIFAVLGEELGLIGCLVVIGLFAALAYRGFRIAIDAPDTFGGILAAGVTCWLIFQALINIAVITATMPFTGIPLPFISFGGSALLTAMAGVGLLLSVSKGTERADTEEYASLNFGWRDGRTRLSRTRRR